MLQEVERIKHEPGAEHRNRMGILLGNKITEDSTKTLTHTLWSLLNVLPPHDAQRPHRHNSVALDLCVFAPPESEGGVYTLMGPELDEEGWVKDPIRCEWKSGAVFVTPPGWWHSHHNETSTPSWVLPMQDAGLYTYQRTLDIRFSTEKK
jgi:gentisate 1,2-dioxygenase